MKSVLLKERLRTIFWVNLALFLFVTFFMARFGPIGKHALMFGCLYAFSFLLLWFIYKGFPNEWPRRKQLFFIICIGILCRFFFLPFPPSHDVNRYLWEGYIYNQGFNPYLHAPSDPVLKPVVNTIWQNINHKDASACYPPMMVLFFSLLAFISQSPLFFKSIVILFDIAVIFILALISRTRETRPSFLIVYALNPLVLVFIAGEGHLDAVQTFFICLSLYLFIHKKDGWGFFALGCAIMSKYYSLILLPFVITNKNWKKIYASMLPLISYIPFMDSGYNLFSSLITFGNSMHYNDSLAVLLRAFFGSHAIFASILLLLICLIVIFLLVHDPMRSSYLAVASLLLIIPTLHPWYLISISFFLVFFPSRAWLYLHFAMIFTFPVLNTEFYTGVFQEIHWLKLLVYLPFFGLLILDFFRHSPLSTQPVFGPVKNLSVVIPVLNESAKIRGALKSLKKEKGLLETIVADGGSCDDTREVARNMGAEVLESERGRGLQIKAGASQCCGDIILVLHADCRIVPGTFERILKELNRNLQWIGGSLGMVYQAVSIKSQFLALLNNVRASWTGISFGDQGQFVRKEVLDIIGGFPKQMLMEDVELSLRLKETGAVCHISKGIEVSQRRWDRTGFFQNFRRVVTLCSAYLIQRRLGLGGSKQKGFYERYYSIENLTAS